MTDSRYSWLPLLLALAGLSLGAPRGAAAQDVEVRCPADLVATGGARWQVFSGDSLVSEHTQVHTALERAIREETLRPGDSTTVDHLAEIRVECPADWRPPGSSDTTYTEPPPMPRAVEAVVADGPTPDSVTVTASWECVERAEYYTWHAGSNSGRWQAEGTYDAPCEPGARASVSFNVLRPEPSETALAGAAVLASAARELGGSVSLTFDRAWWTKRIRDRMMERCRAMGACTGGGR